jgi:hypothetical protein
MSGLVEKKRVALQLKMDALQVEFDTWRRDTEAGAGFEKHQTQVAAVTGHLEGLWSRTRQLFIACGDDTLLQDARNLEALLLGLRRIWEFFRSKLVQRLDQRMSPFLRAADELAWACYHPVMAYYPELRRQPPLVFLNGGMSPFALSRDQAFSAELVIGESLGGATYDNILQRLPVAMIGVPYYQVAYLPDMLVVAHETGHAVASDFRLYACVQANIDAACGTGAPRLRFWASWSHEVFADLWGCLTLGPAYVSALMDFLASDRAELDGEIPSEAGRYPPTHLRINLCVEALRQLEFAEDAASCEAEWRRSYRPLPISDFDDDVPKIVRAVLAKPLPGSQLPVCLMQLPSLRFPIKKWEWAKLAASEVLNGEAPVSATTITTWAAAARALFDASPRRYADNNYAQKMIDRSVQLINPGTRHDEKGHDADDVSTIRCKASEHADDEFEQFAAWSRSSAPRPPEQTAPGLA